MGKTAGGPMKLFHTAMQGSGQLTAAEIKYVITHMTAQLKITEAKEMGVQHVSAVPDVAMRRDCTKYVHLNNTESATVVSSAGNVPLRVVKPKFQDNEACRRFWRKCWKPKKGAKIYGDERDDRSIPETRGCVTLRAAVEDCIEEKAPEWWKEKIQNYDAEKERKKAEKKFKKGLKKGKARAKQYYDSDSDSSDSVFALENGRVTTSDSSEDSDDKEYKKRAKKMKESEMAKFANDKYLAHRSGVKGEKMAAMFKEFDIKRELKRKREVEMQEIFAKKMKLGSGTEGNSPSEGDPTAGSSRDKKKNQSSDEEKSPANVPSKKGSKSAIETDGETQENPSSAKANKTGKNGKSPANKEPVIAMPPPPPKSAAQLRKEKKEAEEKEKAAFAELENKESEEEDKKGAMKKAMKSTASSSTAKKGSKQIVEEEEMEDENEDKKTSSKDAKKPMKKL